MSLPRYVASKTPIDPDAIHPTSIRATFEYTLASMESSAEASGLALNWNSLSMAINNDPTDATMILRAEILR